MVIYLFFSHEMRLLFLQFIILMFNSAKNMLRNNISLLEKENDVAQLWLHEWPNSNNIRVFWSQLTTAGEVKESKFPFGNLLMVDQTMLLYTFFNFGMVFSEFWALFFEFCKTFNTIKNKKMAWNFLEIISATVNAFKS